MASKYKAFISYSHTDEAWARWLQRSIERYRVPSRLVKSVARVSELPRRLYPIFRDTSELASSSNLGSALEQSLRDSENLIVICSPAAVQSRWLNAEIRYFKSLGRADRIFCFMVAGQPELGTEGCAFPPALFEAQDDANPIEHLAADPRTDGKHNALLKIIGALLGVGINDLKQRDAHRRARFWASVAAGSAAFAVAMIGLALYAVSARNEAQLRRGQAENLIGFMLGDLRDRLEPIGRLDVLDAVGDEAMRYFKALDRSATANDLLSRAMALRQIGEVRFNQGRLEHALPAFVESRTVLQQLFDGEEQVDKYLFELGQSEFWVGYVHYERAQYDAAQEAMGNYLKISLALRERQPNDQSYLGELAYAYSNLGSIARARGDQTGALQHFRDSVAVNQDQLALAPDDEGVISDLAGGYSWIGTAEQEIGDLEASEAAFRTALEQFARLAQGQDNARYRERRASSAALLAGVLLMRGKAREAAVEERFAYEEFSSLVAGDPANNRWKRGLAVSARYMAELSHYMGAPLAADRFLAEARRGLEELVAVDPSNSEWREARLDLLELTARIRSERRPRDASLDVLLGSTRDEIIRGVNEMGPSPDVLAILARFARTYAAVAASRGDRATAQQIARDAFTRVGTLSNPPLPLQATLLPLARLLGEQDVTQRLTSAVTASGFAHPWLLGPP